MGVVLPVLLPFQQLLTDAVVLLVADGADVALVVQVRRHQVHDEELLGIAAVNAEHGYRGGPHVNAVTWRRRSARSVTS